MKPNSFWGKIFSNSFSQSREKLKKLKKQHRLDQALVRVLNKSKFPTAKQIKHLPKILSPKEKKQAGILLAVILVCLAILAFRVYFLATVAMPKTGGEYVEGLIGSPRFINPILAQTNDVDTDISRLVFSGLVKFDKNRQLTPDLAERYEVSGNQLTYTFYLKQNVKWHDGENFKADDVVFTIASIQDPNFKSPLSRSFRGLTAEKIDDYTVKFTLTEPFAPFLSLLTVGILPEHLWYNISPANADLTELNKKPIGTGPWRFDSFKKDRSGAIKSYTLVPFDNYYNGKSYLQKIVFKFYGDFVSAVDALKSKEVQGIAYLPKEYKEELKKQKNINYHNLEQPQYTAIFFNQGKNEFLKADYLRQALALATNKEKIINEAFNQEGQIIDGPTLPGIVTNPDIKKYEYNPAAAAELLEKNGWQLAATTTPDGLTYQLRKKKGWYLEVTLTTVNQPENVKTAEIIKESWDQIGVRTTLNIVEPEKIIPDVLKPRNYEALIFGENLGSDPDPFAFWHSSQAEYPGLNLAIFYNKTADKLLEDARKTNDWEIRRKNYSEFQKIVAEQLPAIFLFNPTYTYAQNKNVLGFDAVSISGPADRFTNLNEWYVKTKRVGK